MADEGPGPEDGGGAAAGEGGGAPPGDAPRRRLPPAGGMVNAVHLNDEMCDKLSILDYETNFCAAKDILPFPRTYFALPTQNASMQFGHMMELFKWLMSQCEQDFTTDKYDDPTTSVNKMMLELKGMGFDMDFPAQKLKQAHGEAVCRVLNFLCDAALKLQRFAWGKPSYPEEDFAEEAEVDDDAEVAADIADEGGEVSEEEVMYEEIVRSEGKDADADDAHREALEATVDPIAWKTELERVAPLLKVSGRGTSGKEWRAHLEQTKTHEKTIHEVLPDTQTALRKISSEISNMLDRLVSKEKYINTHFEHLAEEYRTEQEKMREIQETYNSSSTSVTQLTNQLAQIQDELEEVKGSMDDRGQSMTDTSPLIKIKSALTKLKSEIKTMDLRIGVVGHTLMQAKVKHKTGDDAEASRDADFDADDDDFGDD